MNKAWFENYKKITEQEEIQQKKRALLQKILNNEQDLLNVKKSLCNFIEANSDFFAAPFLRKQIFEHFLTQKFPNSDISIGSSFDKFNQCFKKYMTIQAEGNQQRVKQLENEYLKVIMGDRFHNGIVKGDKTSLKTFFDQNQKILEYFILEIASLNQFATLWKKYTGTMKANHLSITGASM